VTIRHMQTPRDIGICEAARKSGKTLPITSEAGQARSARWGFTPCAVPLWASIRTKTMEA
jgi:hypothetical protein